MRALPTSEALLLSVYFEELFRARRKAVDRTPDTNLGNDGWEVETVVDEDEGFDDDE